MFDAQIWVCGDGETTDTTTLCLVNAVKNSKFNLDLQYVSGDALIGRSRSIACSRFLKANLAPYMIFIDTDISFNLIELENLIKALVEGYDVIAGAYSVATGDRLAVRGYTHAVQIDNKIHEMEYISTGFMGISRKCLEKIIKDQNLPLLHKGEWCECYPFFESGRYTPELFYISEDWDFCNKCRASFFKVYLHTGCLVDHVKTLPVVCEDVLEKTKIQNPLALAPELDIIKDLADYLDRPFAQVRDEVLNYSTKSEESRNWLYDLAQFNSFKYYHDERLYPLSALKGHKILDYGCGIGTASFYVAEHNEVVGYDKNTELIHFAGYRLHKNGFVGNITLTDAKPEDLSYFDVILFIDVLEHQEDLKTFMVDLGKQVKRGTRLYHISPFNQPLPGHYDHSKEWPQILEESGFIKIDNNWSIKG